MDVWNYSSNDWELGGEVLDVLKSAQKSGDVELPAGSILVSSGNSAPRWLVPDVVAVSVRRAFDLDSFPVVPDEKDEQSCFRQGEHVQVWSTITEAWEDAVVCNVINATITSGSISIPAGSVMVSVKNGTETHTILPDMFERLLRKHPEETNITSSTTPSASLMCDEDHPTINGATAASTSDGSDSWPVSQTLSVSSTGSGTNKGLPPPDQVLLTPPPTVTVAPSPTVSAPPTPSGGSLTAPPTATSLSSPRPSNRTVVPLGGLRDPPPYDRRMQRLLIIGPGFGRDLNPQQGVLLEQAGYQIRWLLELPNPEVPMFPMAQFLPVIAQAIDEFKPNLLVCASKGGAYMTALWASGLWSGATLVINRHPSFTALPQNASILLAHGSNDEYYQFPREALENFVRTGSPNRCFLYYTANSGLLGRGYTREGDRHNMESLKWWDTLPRLVDATLSVEGPEIQMMRSWRTMLTQERLDAEDWLGYTPGLRRLWQSTDQKGMDDQILFEVLRDSEEYAKVETLFKAQPAVPRAYADMNPGMWQHVSILKIERVENGMQEDGSAEPYYKALQRGIENQGVPFIAGLHTRWVFHGSSAVDSIVTNPISGFQPLMSGTRSNALWGPGTYFARDAKYVYDGGFCSFLPDGSRQILLCLLMNGLVCLGDPNHKGVLPFRHGRHRYNSSVDSLGNPEIFVTQSPGAAYPAYVITFS